MELLKIFFKPTQRKIQGKSSDKKTKELLKCTHCSTWLAPDKFAKQHRDRARKKNAVMCKQCRRAYDRERKYKLTANEYEEIVVQQNNNCAICRQQLVNTNVDHCHKTNKVRGVLCTKCNTGIGKLGDDFFGCLRAAMYLAQHTDMSELDEEQEFICATVFEFLEQQGFVNKSVASDNTEQRLLAKSSGGKKKKKTKK